VLNGKKLADLVRLLRGERTQGDVAAKARLHLKQIQKIEKGAIRKGLRTDTLEKLARGLGVPTQRLQGRPAPTYDAGPLIDAIAADPGLVALLGGRLPTRGERRYLCEVEFGKYDSNVPLTAKRVALALVGLREQPEFLAAVDALDSVRGD
jgi:hypothetical protein